MTYTPGADAEKPPRQNVFVSRDAYRAFLKAGAWPDKTTFILEISALKSKVSIIPVNSLGDAVVETTPERVDQPVLVGNRLVDNRYDLIVQILIAPARQQLHCAALSNHGSAIDLRADEIERQPTGFGGQRGLPVRQRQ